jgi:thiamine biosynthesis protein ThiS
MAETIEITVNGEARLLPRGTTVATLLAKLGVERGRVAVERNLDIVPRSTYDAVTLADGDTVEVVAFVGGG